MFFCFYMLDVKRGEKVATDEEKMSQRHEKGRSSAVQVYYNEQQKVLKDVGITIHTLSN